MTTDASIPVTSLLTSWIGSPVTTEHGATVGRLTDLTVLVGEPHPAVHRFVVHVRRGGTLLVPWSTVTTAGPDGTRITDPAVGAQQVAELRSGLLRHGELLLARDVLDTQVVDLDGRRLSRVGDVLLARPEDGPPEVVAVDVGAGAMLRRMGLRRLAERLPTDVVDWEDLHLTSSRGHVVQLGTVTAGFQRLDTRGLAELLTRLKVEHAAGVMRSVGARRALGALRRSHPAVTPPLLHGLGPEASRQLVAQAEGEEAARLRERRRHAHPLRRRRYKRTAGWRVHRPR